MEQLNSQKKIKHRYWQSRSANLKEVLGDSSIPEGGQEEAQAGNVWKAMWRVAVYQNSRKETDSPILYRIGIAIKNEPQKHCPNQGGQEADLIERQVQRCDNETGD